MLFMHNPIMLILTMSAALCCFNLLSYALKYNIKVKNNNIKVKIKKIHDDRVFKMNLNVVWG
jgi:fumarate reductase subunit C